MTREEMKEKLSNVENIEALTEKILNAQSNDAVLEILKDCGLDTTEAELAALLPADELGEEFLDLVAGGCKGCSCSWFRKGVVWLVNKMFGTNCDCCL